MKCLALYNTLDLIIGDYVFVVINGQVFGKSKVVDLSEKESTVGIRLDINSDKYIEEMQRHNQPLEYFLERA